MTTLDVSEFTRACTKTEGCRHRFCGACGREMRARGADPVAHPGTVTEHSQLICATCYKYALLPEDLEDQRHILMSDKDMARLLRESPMMFIWHMQRRNRLGMKSLVVL